MIKLGTRPSPLALRQAHEIISKLPGYNFKIIKIKTLGDKDLVTSLIENRKDDFFTREIEKALLEGKIDAAVHSAKDLEADMPKGLIIAAMTKSISPYECLVSKNKLTLDKLPKGSIIGTSSQKRKEALSRYRSDLVLKDIRGNINERLKVLDEGKFDAIIVAHAALIRLGLENRSMQVLPKEIVEPHPLQGRLAVQIRNDRTDLLEIFKKIDDK